MKATISLFVIGLGAVAEPLLAQPFVNPSNGSRYFLTPTEMEWLDAQAYAVSMGGNLVTIRSASEQAWIEETFLSGPNSEMAYWIGMTDEVTEGVWEWVSGEPVTFTNWEVGEPNNSLGGLPEDYAVINWHWRYRATTVHHRFGSWNDLPSLGYNHNLGIREKYHGIVEVPVCYANCDGSTSHPVLTVQDFTCFIDQFAAARWLPHEQQVAHYANCDGSTTSPVLTVDDFTCFINAFAQGCP